MHKVVAVLGPTASGKSALAEQLASRLDGELINSDASAVFAELSVGVTKPDAVTRERIPYHLLDVTTLAQGYDLKTYLQQAERAVQEIASRRRLPIVVGGSGLYARALLDGYRLPEIEVSPEIRVRVRGLAPPLALQELENLDPAAYQRIDRHNSRRVQRALELALAVGGPVPPADRSERTDLSVLRLYLQPALDLLMQRIEMRTVSMWEPWTEEVLDLEKKGLADWLGERKPIGYESVLAYSRGELARDEAIDQIVQLTKKLAKKQRTWLKKEAESALSHRFFYDCEEQWGGVNDRALQIVQGFLQGEDPEG